MLRNIEYSNGGGQRRRIFRLFILVALVITTAIAGYEGIQFLSRKGSELYWQSRCAEFDQPVSALGMVYDAAAIVPPGADSWNQPFVPDWYFQPCPAVKYFGSIGAIAFLHTRTAPSGNNRLISVDCSEQTESPMAVSSEAAIYLVANVVIPATWTAAHRIKPWPKELRIPVAKADVVRIWFGQIDPHLSYHFTICLEMNKQLNDIDCWLRKDDTVDLIPRSGTLIPQRRSPGVTYWLPDGHTND